jgi:hypothetical protein
LTSFLHFKIWAIELRDDHRAQVFLAACKL